VHDGGSAVSPNDRVVVRLFDAAEGGYPFKGFILKTSAGTLTVKDSANTQAVSASACDGAIGHLNADNKISVEAYLDLPSTLGTVTVTAEIVPWKTSVTKLTLDIEVVEPWTQVGDDIDALSNYEHLGYSVSMNTDGTRMAVGAPKAFPASSDHEGVGYLRVYQYDQTKTPVWQRMGPDDIIGTDKDENRGTMVSISGDGTRVASIGAPGFGVVKVHEWNSDSQTWTHMSGSFTSAIAVSISKDGTKILVLWSIGEYLSLYELSSEGSWSKVGSDIITATWAPGYSNAQAVAISGNGEYFVLGYPYNAGKVVAFSLANFPDVQQRGDDIFGDLNADRAKLGSSVAISDDGSRIVAGAPANADPLGVYTNANVYGAEPYARVYEFYESTNLWVQLGGDLTMGQQRDTYGYYRYHFGHSLDMSDDGTVIAIRSAEQPTPPTGGRSATHVFRMVSSDPTMMWGRSSSDIVDEGSLVTYSIHHTSLSLSGNGKYAAIGAPLTEIFDAVGTANYDGRVRVFKEPSAASPSPASPSGSCSSSRATGGTVTTSGEYTIHTFTSSGTFEVTDSTLTEVDVLVVGGGGAGGMDSGGGGGGGAVLYSASKTLSSSSITVTVSNGGVYSASDGDGGASAFDGMVANGGKGGKSLEEYDGGGKHGGVSGSGNAGGSGVAYYAAGGGGGAGGPGEAGQQQSEILSFDKGGDGGPGVESAISGTSNYYGGGGGGGVYNFSGRPGSAGNGGLGGGAPGGQVFGSPASSGSAFTGGGGGGSPMMTNDGAGPGGSGVVIVRYTSATCSCGTDYYHDGSDCVACPTGSTRMPDTDNECLCPANYHRKLDGGVYSCAACAQGATRPAGDTVPGGTATTCTESAPSAEDKKKQAETTRDSILDDISDARVKAKAKLLADAAIAGVKVQRLSAKLTAADEDTACSETFSKAGMSAGDGACVATAASSGKRRSLSAMAYDVELMFSASTVNDDALKAAELELKNNGVEGVTSQTSVDPIAELKTVPGVDMGKLQTFETEASASATATAAEAQTPPPPTPPPPPKPNLVLDDDDGTVGLVGKAGLLMATAFAILAM